MNNSKHSPIRILFSKPDDSAVWERFKTLAVVKGESPPDYLIRIIEKDLGKKSNADILQSATWVKQADLIKRLKTDYQIKTNSQTLYNYRKGGLLNGLFGTDGGQLIMWNLEGVAKAFKEMQK